MIFFLESGLLVDLDVDGRSFLGFDLEVFSVDGDDRAQDVLTGPVSEGCRSQGHAHCCENQSIEHGQLLLPQVPY